MGPWLIWQMKSWNLADFMVKSGGFHGKDLYNIYLYWFWWWKIQHSVVYHEIRWISWNSADFMARSSTMYICIGSDEKYSIQGYTMKSGRFHDEIWRISWWNLADFMHGIWWISWPWNPPDFMPRTLVLMKNTAFSGRPYCISVLVLKNKTKIQYSWNPADFMVKSGEFHEIRWISWNPADFIHEIRRISWLILKNANFFYNAYNFFSM